MKLTGRPLSVLVAMCIVLGSLVVVSAPAATAASKPSVSSVSPSVGASKGGTKVTIRGKNFKRVAKVLFGSRVGTRLKVSSSGALSVYSPSGQAGPVDVRVVSGAGTSARSSNAKFTYRAIPVVSSVSPNAGPVTGGTTVTVTGSGFYNVSKVTFATSSGVTLKVTSSTKLTVNSPTSIAGVSDIRVVSRWGTSATSTRSKYTYTAPHTQGPAPVTNFSASAKTTDSVTLGWTNPAESDFDGTVIRRAIGSEAPASPTAGTPVTSAPKTAAAYTDTDLEPDTTYSYAAFASDTADNHSAAASLTVTTDQMPCLPAIVHVTADITTDTTWTPDCTSVYVVDHGAEIRLGATLTIAPGTVLKFNGSGLSVRGSLLAHGTPDNPITFTSITDDSVKGDTNGDGSFTGPTPGAWYGIDMHDGTLDLDHVQVLYAKGVGASYGFEDVANPHAVSITNSQFRNLTSVDAGGGGIGYSQGGIAIRQYPGTDPITISGNQIEGTRGTGIDVFATASAVISENSVSGTTVPISYSGPIDGPKLAGNTGSGNTYKTARFSGDVRGDLELPVVGIPWSFGTIAVPDGANLTAEAGTILKFEDPSGVVPALTVTGGSLVAEGTAAQPVVFTSIKDDSVGGDSNGDAAETVPTNESWRGISVLSGRAAIRGTIKYASTAIRACNWASAVCSVDATYVDWGSSLGARPNAEDGLVCGAVVAVPWIGQDENATAPTFATRNCDNSDSPDIALRESQDMYDDKLSDWVALCGLSQDACEHAQRMRTCLAEGLSLAKAGSTFPILENSEDWVTEGANQVIDIGTKYLRNSLDEVVSYTGYALAAGAEITRVVSLLSALNSAYDNCFGQ